MNFSYIAILIFLAILILTLPLALRKWALKNGKLKLLSETPFWFVAWQSLLLLPIIAWPIVFFGSIFIFDNPQNIIYAFVLFIAVNAYPLITALWLLLASKLYKNHQLISVFLLISLTTAYGFIIFTFIK